MSDLSNRIASALSASLHAAEIDALMVEARKELASVTAKRNKIEAEALDPRVSSRFVLQKKRGEITNLDFAIKRLNLALEKLGAELEAATARDKLAREQAAKAADMVAAAEMALEARADAVAAELRDLIETGAAALAALDAANNALPKAERQDAPPMLARLRVVPERVVSTHDTERWLRETDGSAVAEDKIRVWPTDTIERLREQRIADLRDTPGRVFLKPVTEVTFVPAHRYDWLHPEPPAQQVRVVPRDEPLTGEAA